MSAAVATPTGAEGKHVWRPTIVAGQRVAELLDAERGRLVPRSSHWSGCFQSEPLCAWQQDVHRRGFRDVELVESIYGWGVRSGSGIDNFALLASSRAHEVDGSLEDAVRWAAAWCAQDPDHRYAWRR